MQSPFAQPPVGNNLDWTFYGLCDNGFRRTPAAGIHFTHRRYRAAFEAMLLGIELGEGFVLLTGAPGTGKTTLAADLLGELRNQGRTCAEVSSTQVGSYDLLRLVAAAFGLDHEEMDETELLLLLEKQLLVLHEIDQPAVLMIDEAQNLGPEALAALRRLAKATSDGKSLLQIMLFGESHLVDKLQEPAYAQLRRLIVNAYELSPLDAFETREYIAHRLVHVGWDGVPRLSGEALREIYACTAGIPGNINGLMTQLLWLGITERLHDLDIDEVRQVMAMMADSRLLPADAERDHADEGSVPVLRPLDESAVDAIRIFRAVPKAVQPESPSPRSSSRPLNSDTQTPVFDLGAARPVDANPAPPENRPDRPAEESRQQARPAGAGPGSAVGRGVSTASTAFGDARRRVTGLAVAIRDAMHARFATLRPQATSARAACRRQWDYEVAFVRQSWDRIVAAWRRAVIRVRGLNLTETFGKHWRALVDRPARWVAHGIRRAEAAGSPHWSNRAGIAAMGALGAVGLGFLLLGDAEDTSFGVATSERRGAEFNLPPTGAGVVQPRVGGAPATGISDSQVAVGSFGEAPGPATAPPVGSVTASEPTDAPSQPASPMLVSDVSATEGLGAAQAATATGLNPVSAPQASAGNTEIAAAEDVDFSLVEWTNVAHNGNAGSGGAVATPALGDIADVTAAAPAQTDKQEPPLRVATADAAQHDAAIAAEARVAAEIERLIGLAEKAIAAERYTVPAGKNAYGYYREVLSLDPGNAAARAGLARISDLYWEMAGDVIAAGEFDKAEVLIRRALRKDPGNARLEERLREIALQRTAAAPVPPKPQVPVIKLAGPEDVPQRRGLFGRFSEPADSSWSDRGTMFDH